MLTVEAILHSLLQQVAEAPGINASELQGDMCLNLTALKELWKLGLVTGTFVIDSTQSGELLLSASNLELSLIPIWKSPIEDGRQASMARLA